MLRESVVYIVNESAEIVAIVIVDSRAVVVTTEAKEMPSASIVVAVTELMTLI